MILEGDMKATIKDIERVGLAISNSQRYTPSLTAADFQHMKNAKNTTSYTEYVQNTCSARAALREMGYEVQEEAWDERDRHYDAQGYCDNPARGY